MASVRPDTASDPLIGQMVGGRYELLRRIGKGGMGVVYEADHTGLGKRVAVKLLLDKYTDDPEVVARFQREARTASAIGDEHIVEVTDAGQHEDGRSYIVMELLEGGSLAEVLDACGPMPAARAVHIVRQVLRGLGAAHAKGIVHRDMKPENVFLVSKGDRVDFVKIMDFGISKFMMSTESKVRLTATGAVIGTPVYMAPEQAMALGEVDARVDLYAVGVMLYELLAGHPPFQAPSYIALVTQHLNLPPPPLGAERPDLPRSLVGAVHHALEKDPAHRFQTAADMAQAIPAPDALAYGDQMSTLGSSGEYLGASRGGAPMAMGRAVPGAYSTPGTSVPTGSQPFALPPDRSSGIAAPARSRWPIAIGGLAVLIAAVILVIGLGGGRRAAAPAAGPDPGGPGGPGGSGGSELATAGSAGSGEGSAEPIVDTEHGSLEIVSQPAGAIVFIDGVERGKTPLVVAEVTAGIHSIRLAKDGHTEMTINKSVRGGRDETVSATLAVTTTPQKGASGASHSHGGSAKRGGGSAKTGGGGGSAKTGGDGSGAGSGSAKAGGGGSGSGSGSAKTGGGGPRNPYDDDPPVRDRDRDKKRNPYD
jgi:serine/threonine-protein kinase